MKKAIAFLLVLLIVLSLVPMSVCATTIDITLGPGIELGGDFSVTINGEKVDFNIKDSNDGVEAEKEEAVGKKEKKVVYYHPTGEHEYGYASNAKYHWLQCPCGCQINKEPHVAPEDAVNDYCTCGYHFSSNAELVTLWINGCPPIKNFNKDTTEYKLNAYTYKDVKEIKVSTRTFDSEATVELPEDLTLKEGENKFDIKVVSENKKVTKVYTVIITKEAKK